MPGCVGFNKYHTSHIFVFIFEKKKEIQIAINDSDLFYKLREKSIFCCHFYILNLLLFLGFDSNIFRNMIIGSHMYDRNFMRSLSCCFWFFFREEFMFCCIIGSGCLIGENRVCSVCRLDSI